MKYKCFYQNFSLAKYILVKLVLLAMVTKSFGQVQEENFKDLSGFIEPGKNWKVAGNVFADLDEQNKFEIKKGSGVLVNNPKKGEGQDLFTKNQYGSIDLELDFMMAKGSNSGIYFQGQYELQLFDSWGSRNISSGDNGGIYERWDEERPEGEKGFEGYAPRQNVSKAPGLWQHLEVSFQAPKFDDNGVKVENAKFIYVRLNGVTIHENLELSGPTRGSLDAEEKSAGPIRIQGDHGAVAFRNMNITSFDKPRPKLTNLNYKIYTGKFDDEPDYNNLPPESEGKSVVLTSDLRTESNQFLIRYTGDLQVEEAGEYTFDLSTPGGAGLIRINDNEIVPFSNEERKATMNLPAGSLPFELVYSKFQDWVQPGLGLSVSGVGVRDYLISDGSANFEDPVDPILVEANTSKVFRSFMNIPSDEKPGGYLLTHAVSVGNPKQIHYTYDLSSGAIAQLWRGDFLDATPMWYNRGNGTSRPVGSVVHFDKPKRTVGKITSPQKKWDVDTTGMNFKSLGYTLDQNDLPSFTYEMYGSPVQDFSKVLDDAKGIKRKISIENPVEKLHVRLISGKKIQKLSNDLYLIGDKEFYIRLDDIGKAKPVVRGNAHDQELLLPLSSELVYSLLF